MATFDFKDIGVVIGLLGGSAGVAVFKDLFASPRERAKELANALDSPLTIGKSWVSDQRKRIFKALCSPLRLFLSILYFLILVCFLILLLIGPQNVLASASWGSLAEPLTKGEFVLYAIMHIQLSAVYIWLVVLPAYRGWSVIIRATYWLWKNRR